jgi:hypothetical protein
MQGRMFSWVLAVSSGAARTIAQVEARAVEQGVPDPYVPERPAASGTVEEVSTRQGWVGIFGT